MKELEQTHKTKRLIIRPFEMADANALYDILRDRQVNIFIPLKVLTDPKEATQILQDHFAADIKIRNYYFAICLKENNIPIGYVTVSQKNAPYDFGYALRSDFWNRGITTEAAKSILEQLKQDGLSYLTATHDVNNPASGQVMEKIGFKYHYSYDEIWEKNQQLVTFRMYQLNFDQSIPVYQGYKEKYPWSIEDI